MRGCVGERVHDVIVSMGVDACVSVSACVSAGVAVSECDCE